MAPFFQNGANLDLRCVLLPAPWVLGAKHVSNPEEEFKKKNQCVFKGLPTDEVIFTDTSFIETVVFSDMAGIMMGPGVEHWLRSKRYAAVFFLAPLEAYEQTQVRRRACTRTLACSAWTHAHVLKHACVLLAGSRITGFVSHANGRIGCVTVCCQSQECRCMRG